MNWKVSMCNLKTLIVVQGPTAIGKTALGIKLAQYFKTDIISADSRQFFKEMAIGTAVPTTEELTKVKHHFIQHLSIYDNYSVGNFEADALSLLKKLFQDTDVVIMVGGSGLYVKAVCEGLDIFPETKPEVREKLRSEFETRGIAALQERLKKMDPEYYEKIDVNNPHRVIRALEVCISSDRPFSSYLNTRNRSIRFFEIVKIGLSADRTTIYERINNRVNKMMELGLLDEAKKLKDNRELNALQTVGYRELFQYFDGNITLTKAIEEIKKNTRRYAKRQLTWLRKEDDIFWFDWQYEPDEIVHKIHGLIKRK